MKLYRYLVIMVAMVIQKYSLYYHKLLTVTTMPGMMLPTSQYCLL